MNATATPQATKQATPVTVAANRLGLQLLLGSCMSLSVPLNITSSKSSESKYGCCVIAMLRETQARTLHAKHKLWENLSLNDTEP